MVSLLHKENHSAYREWCSLKHSASFVVSFSLSLSGLGLHVMLILGSFYFHFFLLYFRNVVFANGSIFSLQLVSPDDLVNAAKLFSSVNMPLK